MSTPHPHLQAALRATRLESALALALQNGMDPGDQDRLRLKLTDARRVEAELRAAGGEALPLQQLGRRLGLRPVDERVLLLAAALELDPIAAITLSAIAGEEPRQGISPKLVAQVLGFAGDESVELRLDGGHPLVRSALLESTAPVGYPDSLRPYRLSARGVSFLLGDEAIDPALERLGGLVAVPEGAANESGQAARALVEQVLRTGEPVILCIEGLDGVGRRTTVAAAARACGTQVVAVDAARLSSERVRAAAELRALRRECWLRGAVPVVARVDVLAQRDRRSVDAFTDVAEALEAVDGPAVVTALPGIELPAFQRRVVRVRVGSPSPGERLQQWSRALGQAGGEGAALDPELTSTVRMFQLTPGGIDRAAANVRMIAQGRALTPADVRAGVAAEIQERFQGLANRVEVSQSWEDLVLPQDTLDDVKAFAARAVHAGRVYDDWGFRDKLQRGLGLAALFSGPPGTGKTMVAGLIARSLGLELYMVDLAQVVSKWVGETEKQLGKIFDAASMGNVILLFDEADALFAKRTEVRSSNDRYANLEVNYLLGRIEQFGGVAILTTNLEASVDAAFKRRLAADIHFYAPELAEREHLWRTLLPGRAPVEGKLDFGQLAEVYKEMCGGHIRNAVLRAAFLAAAEGGSITQALLHRAATVEYRAMGKVL